MSNSNFPKAIVIVGPTASGKTGVAIELAQKYNGEIISADSRAIYKYMNLGTAKPTLEEQSLVPHHGIDLVEPDERFTAADFKQYALEQINNIRSRGKIPFLVGGTGLYIDSVIFDYQFNETTSPHTRTDLEQSSIKELIEYCQTNNILLPENSKNKRYLIRAIETGGVVKNNRARIKKDFIVVGIATDKEILRSRIATRAEQMFTDALVTETNYLTARYGFHLESMKSNIYRVAARWITNEITLEQAKAEFIQLDLKLAKRQLTWFRRNPEIHWLPLAEIPAFVSCLFDEHKNDTINSI